MWAPVLGVHTEAKKYRPMSSLWLLSAQVTPPPRLCCGEQGAVNCSWGNERVMEMKLVGMPGITDFMLATVLEGEPARSLWCLDSQHHVSPNRVLCCASFFGREWAHPSTLRQRVPFPWKWRDSSLLGANPNPLRQALAAEKISVLQGDLWDLLIPDAGLTVIRNTRCLQKPEHSPPVVLCWLQGWAYLSDFSFSFPEVPLHWQSLQGFQRDQGFRSSLSLRVSRWHWHSSCKENVDVILKPRSKDALIPARIPLKSRPLKVRDALGIG